MNEQRTIKQNKMLWSIIYKIVEFEDAYIRPMGADSMQILASIQNKEKEVEELYKSLLISAGVFIQTIVIKTDDIDQFTKQFKVYYTKTGDQVVKGESWSIIKIFRGSSQLNVNEMNNLIDTAIKYAEQIGLNIKNERTQNV